MLGRNFLVIHSEWLFIRPNTVDLIKRLLSYTLMSGTTSMFNTTFFFQTYPRCKSIQELLWLAGIVNRVLYPQATVAYCLMPFVFLVTN